MAAIWAVARTLIKEVLRMHFLVAFIIVLTLSYTVGLGVWLQFGAGPGDEKLQTFLSYSLRFSTASLSLLTVFLSIATVTRDIARREVFTIATKPVTRAQFLAGKYLGMALFNLVLLGVTMGLIGGVAWWLSRQAPRNAYERAQIRELVLVARNAVEPPVPDLREQARAKMEQIIQDRRRSENWTDEAEIAEFRVRNLPQVHKQLMNAARAVAPGETIHWVFEGIKPLDPIDGSIYIRYKHEVSTNPPELKTFGEWIIGPEDPMVAGGFPVRTYEDIRTPHEFPVPVGLVSPEGRLHVIFRNPLANGPVTVIFPLDKGMQVLYVAGRFPTNFLRGAALIYVRLLFIGALGLAAGAWLSFPVAVLMVLVIYLLGATSGFLMDAVQWDAPGSYGQVLKTILPLFPQLAKYDATAPIEKGMLVSTGTLLGGVFWLWLLKGGAAALVGYLIYRFRELARVIV